MSRIAKVQLIDAVTKQINSFYKAGLTAINVTFERPEVEDGTDGRFVRYVYGPHAKITINMSADFIDRRGIATKKSIAKKPKIRRLP